MQTAHEKVTSLQQIQNKQLRAGDWYKAMKNRLFLWHHCCLPTVALPKQLKRYCPQPPVEPRLHAQKSKDHAVLSSLSEPLWGIRWGRVWRAGSWHCVAAAQWLPPANLSRGVCRDRCEAPVVTSHCTTSNKPCVSKELFCSFAEPG